MRVPRRAIDTLDLAGHPNGKVVLIWADNEPILPEGTSVRQVYMTTIQKNRIKGPHQHNKRWSNFVCIKGDVKVVIVRAGHYHEYFTGENYEYALIKVAPGEPAALQNMGSCEALVLNLPTAVFDPEDNFSVEFKGYEWHK